MPSVKELKSSLAEHSTSLVTEVSNRSQVAVKAVLLALPLPIVLSFNFTGSIVLILVISMCGYFANNLSNMIRSIGLAAAMLVATMNVLVAVWPGYGIDARAALSILVLCTLTILWFTASNSSRDEFDWWSTSIMAVFAVAMTVPARFYSPAESLSFVSGIAGSSEDNGAWLVAISKMVEGENTSINAAGTFAGGNSTALILGFTRELARLGSSWFTGTFADGAKILVSSMVLMCIAVTYLGAEIVLRTARSFALVTRSGSVIATVSVFAFSMGLVEIGHYSALVAAAFLVLAQVAGMRESESGTSPTWGKVATATCLLAAGQAWMPLIPAAGIYVLWASASWLAELGRRNRSSLLRGSVVIVGAFVLISARVFPTYLQAFSDKEFFLFNLRLGGGAPLIRLDFLIVIVLLVALVMLRSGEPKWRSEGEKASIVLIGTWAFLILASLGIEPFQLQYGALKYSFIVGLVLLPSAFGWMIGWGSKQRPPILVVGLSSLLVVLVSLVDGRGANWNLLHRADTHRWEWANGVINAAQMSGGGAVGCITMDKSGRVQENSESYLCSRISFGLTGHDEPEHRMWTAYQGCEQDPVDWSPKFLSKLTVVVEISDLGKACGESESSPRNPFQLIDWSKITMVNYSGQVVGWDSKDGFLRNPTTDTK